MRNWKPVKKHLNIYEYNTKAGTRYGVRKKFTVQSTMQRKEVIKSGFKSIKDAEFYLKDMESQISKQDVNPLLNQTRTFDDLFNTLMDFKTKNQRIRKSTISSYNRIYNRHLKDSIGMIKVSNFTRISYSNLLVSFVDQGLARLTVQGISTFLQMLLNFAETNDLIDKNRLRGITFKGGAIPKDKSIEPSQFDFWIETAQKILPRFDYLMIRLSTIGERRGELLGLRFGDVEFANNNGTARIEWKIQRTSDANDGGALKTESSYRTNVVTGVIAKELFELIQISKNRYTDNEKIPSKDDFILVNKFSTPVGLSFPLQTFYKVNDEVNAHKNWGIHYNPHKMRHFFATEALNNPNISDMAAMHWLGHSSLEMTSSYSRNTEENSENLFDEVKSQLRLIE